MDGWTYRKRRGGNLIVKEILSVHSNGCDVWWMMILNALNSQTGFGIKLGGGREAVVSACKNLIDLRSLWSPLLVVTHLRTHGCDSAPQQPIPEWCKLHGVCVCIHEKDREREGVGEGKIYHSRHDNEFPSSRRGRWAQLGHSDLFSELPTLIFYSRKNNIGMFFIPSQSCQATSHVKQTVKSI